MHRPEVIQQKLENWYSASIRALAAEPNAAFRAQQLYIKTKPQRLPSPYLQLSLDQQPAYKLRGLADSMALRIQFSDPGLHQQLIPEKPLARLVFELLEQLRVESLAPPRLPGMRVNLRERFVHWAKQAAASKLIENSVGLLVYSLLVICWTRLLNQTIPEQVEVEIEATRMGLARAIGDHLYAFKSLTHDQRAFAEHALAIASAINDMAGDATYADKDDSEDSLEQALSALLTPTRLAVKLDAKWLSGDSSDWQVDVLTPTEAINFEFEEFEYQVFTKAYDKVVKAEKQVRAAQLKKLRDQLDKTVAYNSINTHRIARYLKSLIATPVTQGWSFGKEQGYLDSARLSQLISSPNERRLFRQEAQSLSSNCVISIVIDNSGSMTKHNEVVAALIDTLLKICHIAEIRTEVLGFTTGEWNGGKVLKEWLAAGKPVDPGRLNSLCHIIYKDAETPWRRARPAIASLLKADLFKESIDGEALQWAAQRLHKRSESRKIVLMISDGSPMDSATLAANQKHYLDSHLAQITCQIENRPDMHLCAVGVGLDLSPYYQHHLAIGVGRPLSNQDYHKLADLLTDNLA